MTAPAPPPTLDPFRAFLLGTRLSWTQGLRLTLRGWRLWAGFGLVLVIVVLEGVLIGATRHRSPVDLYVVINGLLVLNTILPFLTLISSLGLTSGEIEDGTFGYLLTRPCPRIALLVGRVLAGATVTAAALTVLFMLGVVAVDIAVGRSPRTEPTASLGWHLAGVGAIGGLAFTSLYSAIALYCRRPVVALVVGVSHALVWEGIVATLPGSIGGYTLTQNVRALFFDHPEVGPWAERMLFRDVELVPPAPDALAFLLIASGIFIAVAWHRFAGREF